MKCFVTWGLGILKRKKEERKKEERKEEGGGEGRMG